MIAIVDYGVGNLKSIENAIRIHQEDVSVHTVSNPEELKNCSKIILPGVGAFGHAIKKIRESGFDGAIFEEVKKGKYLLGICLGMQLLATRSYEYGEHDGLNLIDGDVVNLRSMADGIRVPHIGWNEVEKSREDGIFDGIEDRSDFYFVHSYFYDCKNAAAVIGLTEYSVKFPSVIGKDNVYGVQFHPEKSQAAGLRLIKNFLSLN